MDIEGGYKYIDFENALYLWMKHQTALNSPPKPCARSICGKNREGMILLEDLQKLYIKAQAAISFEFPPRMFYCEILKQVSFQGMKTDSREVGSYLNLWTWNVTCCCGLLGHHSLTWTWNGLESSCCQSESGILTWSRSGGETAILSSESESGSGCGCESDVWIESETGWANEVRTEVSNQTAGT